MTTHQTPTVLRGAAQLLAGVPYLLDYRPERSLVLVGSVLDRARPTRDGKATLPVTMLLRVDLPAAEEAGTLLEQLVAPVARMVRERGSGCLDPLALLHLFLYDADDDLARTLVAECLARMPRAGAEVHRALLVRDGRYRSLLVDDADGPATAATATAADAVDGAPVWLPLPDPSDVPGLADFVLEGRNPGRSRADVAARVRHREEHAAAATGIAAALLDLTPSRLDPVAAMGGLGRWAVHGTPEPSAKERAAIGLTLESRWVRDLVLARWLPDIFPPAGLELEPADRLLLQALPSLPKDVPAVVTRLLHLAARTPVERTPALLTIASCLAWRHGEGTVANEAVDLALEVDPEYRMAQLMQHALSHGISPWAMRQAAAA